MWPSFSTFHPYNQNINFILTSHCQSVTHIHSEKSLKNIMGDVIRRETDRMNKILQKKIKIKEKMCIDMLKL